MAGNAEKARNRVAAEGAALAAEGMLLETSERFALFTDSESVRDFVLVGFAIRDQASGTMIVPAKDYDGFRVLQALRAAA